MLGKLQIEKRRKKFGCDFLFLISYFRQTVNGQFCCTFDKPKKVKGKQLKTY